MLLELPQHQSGSTRMVASRSESILDYYSYSIESLTVDPDHSHCEITQTQLGRISPFKRSVSPRPEHEEFGLQPKHGGEGEIYSANISHATYVESSPRLSKQLPRFTNASDTRLSKSASISRIPIYSAKSSDTSPSAIHSISIPDLFPADLGKTSNNNEADTSSATRGVSRSRSLLFHQQNQQMRIGDFKNTMSQQRFDSLPSRSVKRDTGSSVRRAASTSSSYRPVAHKDAREWREDQMKRVQAINQAPTGPPPWLGNFQPDPRLPADQQILPTVARKLALERWTSDDRMAESVKDMSAEGPRPAVMLLDPQPNETHKHSQESKNQEMQSQCDTAMNHVISPSVCGQSTQLTTSRITATPNFSHRSSPGAIRTASTNEHGSGSTTSVLLPVYRQSERNETGSQLREQMTEQLPVAQPRDSSLHPLQAQMVVRSAKWPESKPKPETESELKLKAAAEKVKQRQKILGCCSMM